MPKSKTKTAAKRTSVRKTRAESKGDASKKALAAKSTKVKALKQPQHNATGSNRAEGVRLFTLAGRPTKEQFILVYGEAGPRMTWAQRAAAGIPAERFQQALTSKQRGK